MVVPSEVAVVASVVLFQITAMSADSSQEAGIIPDRPTPGLADKVSLIQSYKFGATKPNKVPGADLISLYSITEAEGTRVKVSPIIPNTSGQPEYRGLLWPGHLNGWVWTSYVERIGEIDLATKEKVTTLNRFDIEKFKQHKNVIPFANGYAVNLYGAIIEDDNIMQAGSSLCYTNKEGRKLLGRLITEKVENGRKVLEEKILK